MGETLRHRLDDSRGDPDMPRPPVYRAAALTTHADHPRSERALLVQSASRALAHEQRQRRLARKRARRALLARLTHRATPTSPTLHQRRSLASSIELALDPRAAARRGLAQVPCIPAGNRTAVHQPLEQAIAVLRDETTILNTPLNALAALVLSPASALYQQYPNHARHAANTAHAKLIAGCVPAPRRLAVASATDAPANHPPLLNQQA
jgi:hypothetical protein